MRVPLVQPVLRYLCIIALKWVKISTGVSLPAECEIGEGLYIGHYGALIVTPGAHIGRHCNLSQGVTIGAKPKGSTRAYPRLGDRVYVGPNAIIIGDVSIGDDVAVGAGDVVTKSVPSRAVVAGNPARIISYKGSFDYVQYDRMDSDTDRLISLQTLQSDHDPLLPDGGCDGR